MVDIYVGGFGLESSPIYTIYSSLSETEEGMKLLIIFLLSKTMSPFCSLGPRVLG
jgi:hypothetical protein